MVIFHRYVNVYQRVDPTFWTKLESSRPVWVYFFRQRTPLGPLGCLGDIQPWFTIRTSRFCDLHDHRAAWFHDRSSKHPLDPNLIFNAHV